MIVDKSFIKSIEELGEHLMKETKAFMENQNNREYALLVLNL